MMPLDPETINQQYNLLAAHRRTLAALLQQQAAFGGMAHAPPSIAKNITEARAEIARIKGGLRADGVQVADEPYDEAPSQPGLVMSSRQVGDAISSDKVGGDKVGGDKVMGNKRTIDTGGGDYAEGDILAASISGKGIAIGHGAQAHVTVNEAERTYDVQGLANPYLGLRAFTYADNHLYAGRQQDIDAAVVSMTTPGTQRSLLFITGASGSGKSSFAQAGLLPALEQHYAQRHLTTRHAVFRPSRYPLAGLADALRQLGLPADMLMLDAILSKPMRLGQFIQHTTPPHQINLIVVDQFEELFTQSEPEQCGALFVILEELPSFADLHTHIVATVRSDYLPELFQSKTLYAKVKEGIELRAMIESELKQAIQRPLQQHTDAKDKRFENALLNRLAHDAAADAAYLPLLQVTLDDLWERGWLKLSQYDTLTDAIRQRAEQIYTTFPDGMPRPQIDCDAILAIFLDLVEVSLDEDARRDVRRRRTLAELVQGRLERERLVRELTDARLLSMGLERRDGHDVEVIDIIHESLIQNWERLRQEIGARRETLQQRVRFELALQEWLDNGRANRYLLTDVRLEEARALDRQDDVALRNVEAQELVKNSVAKREAERHRRLKTARIVIVALSILVVVSMAAAWWALDRQQIANNEANARANAEAVALERADEARTAQAQAEQSAAEAHNRALISAAQAAFSQGNTVQGLVLAIAAAEQEQSSLQAEFLLSQIAYGPSARKIFTTSDLGDQAITTAAFSNDGEQVVAGYSNGTLHVWEIATSRELYNIPGHVVATSVAFNSNKTRVAAGSKNGEVLIYDLVRGSNTSLIKLTEPTGAVPFLNSKVVFTRDDRQILAAFEDGPALLLNTSTGAVERRWDVKSLTLSSGGRYVLARGNEKSQLQLLDLNGKKEPVSFVEPEGVITSYQISSDGRFAVFGFNDGTIQLFDVAKGKEIHRYVGHTGSIGSISFHRPFLISGSFDNGVGSADRTVRLWDLNGDRELYRYTGHIDDITIVSFSPDGRHILSGSADGTLQLWDVNNGAEQARIGIAEGSVPRIGNDIVQAGGDNDIIEVSPIVNVAFDLNSSIAVTDSFSNTVRLWNLTTGKSIRDLIQTEVDMLALSADGTRVAFSSEENVSVWDVNAGRELRIFKIGIVGRVGALALNSNGSQVLVAEWGRNKVERWDVNNGQELLPLASSERIDALAFSPDGSKIAAGSGNKVQVWASTTGQALSTYKGDTNDSITEVVFSPKGERVLASSFLGRLYLWDGESKRLLRRIEAHNDRITALDISSDGTLAASGSVDKTLRLWSLETGQELRRFSGHLNTVTGVAFSPNGSSIFSSSSDGTIRQWRIETKQKLIAWICKNRYVPGLTLDQRVQYGIPQDLELCPE